MFKNISLHAHVCSRFTLTPMMRTVGRVLDRVRSRYVIAITLKRFAKPTLRIRGSEFQPLHAHLVCMISRDREEYRHVRAHACARARCSNAGLGLTSSCTTTRICGADMHVAPPKCIVPRARQTRGVHPPAQPAVRMTAGAILVRRSPPPQRRAQRWQQRSLHWPVGSTASCCGRRRGWAATLPVASRCGPHWETLAPTRMWSPRRWRQTWCLPAAGRASPPPPCPRAPSGPQARHRQGAPWRGAAAACHGHRLQQARRRLWQVFATVSRRGRSPKQRPRWHPLQDGQPRTQRALQAAGGQPCCSATPRRRLRRPPLRRGGDGPPRRRPCGAELSLSQMPTSGPRRQHRVKKVPAAPQRLQPPWALRGQRTAHGLSPPRAGLPQRSRIPPTLPHRPLPDQPRHRCRLGALAAARPRDCGLSCVRPTRRSGRQEPQGRWGRRRRGRQSLP